MTHRIEHLLAEVGFNGLEAAVYLALCREPGSTGYRIAQAIGKPAANTYKALDALVRKGAAAVDGTGRSRIYAAVPIGEHLERVKQDIEATRRELDQELSDLGSSTVAEGIYKLTGAEQVYARVRAMLAGAKSVVLLDIWPTPLEAIRSDVEAACRRGVKVLIKAYTPVQVDCCEVIAPQSDAPHLAVWKGDWLNIVVDCREFVLALLKKEGGGVYEALWSRNSYLALLTHNWVMSEQAMTRMGDLLHANGTPEDIFKEVRRMSWRYMSDTPMREVAAQWVSLRHPGQESKTTEGQGG